MDRVVEPERVKSARHTDPAARVRFDCFGASNYSGIQQRIVAAGRIHGQRLPRFDRWKHEVGPGKSRMHTRDLPAVLDFVQTRSVRGGQTALNGDRLQRSDKRLRDRKVQPAQAHKHEA